jgi:hypothetical protein
MSCVETALSAALDREWEAQSGRRAPLETTGPVRTALELVLAGASAGIFAAEWVTGTTPDEVVGEIRSALPQELSPWTRRSLDRLAALRVSSPRLGAGDPVAALPPAAEPVAALPSASEAIPIGPADIPQLPVPEPAPKPVPQPPAPIDLQKRSPLAGLRSAAVAAPVGAGIAAASAAADVGVLAAAGGGALIAAVLVRLLRGRR